MSLIIHGVLQLTSPNLSQKTIQSSYNFCNLTPGKLILVVSLGFWRPRKLSLLLPIVAPYCRYLDYSMFPSSPQCWSWNHLTHRKINIPIWQVIHGKLPMLVSLQKLGFCLNSSCHLCNTYMKSENRLFVECPVASTQWKFFPASFSSVFDLSRCRNLLCNRSRLGLVHEGIMMVFIWVIWNFRNHKMHSSTTKTHSNLANEVQILSHLWINSRMKKGNTLRWIEWCNDPISKCL